MAALKGDLLPQRRQLGLQKIIKLWHGFLFLWSHIWFFLHALISLKRPCGPISSKHITKITMQGAFSLSTPLLTILKGPICPRILFWFSNFVEWLFRSFTTKVSTEGLAAVQQVHKTNQRVVSVAYAVHSKGKGKGQDMGTTQCYSCKTWPYCTTLPWEIFVTFASSLDTSLKSVLLVLLAPTRPIMLLLLLVL